MKWRFINTGFNSGRFNMEYDIKLANEARTGEAVFRLYRWEPYCISIGANQNFESVDERKAAEDNIGIVKRPTGGRAILHAEEITYSVILPPGCGLSAREAYREINMALQRGLLNYDARLCDVCLENNQPDFKDFYKEEKSAVCFAVSARSELKFQNKKLVGSAQRKIGDTILQHGSILCGDSHLSIIDYLKLPGEKKEALREEIQNTTADLGSILSEETNYRKLEESLLAGFEEYFDSTFEKTEYDRAEEILS